MYNYSEKIPEASLDQADPYWYGDFEAKKTGYGITELKKIMQTEIHVHSAKRLQNLQIPFRTVVILP